MQPSRPYHNIALVGFMGVGKSTVGQILAGMLDFEFIDTDR
ncbi:MAG: Shikimate kinase, partial [Verrucomicrobiota bacterium]